MNARTYATRVSEENNGENVRPSTRKKQKPTGWNVEIYSLYVYLNIVCDVTIGRLGWTEE
jgi:hypothetical protein